MTTDRARTAAKEPSHAAIIQVIEVRFAEVLRRLEHGENRFDRIEAKMDHADEARSEMQSDIAMLKQAAATATERPWWLGWKPLAVLLALAFFGGGGAVLLLIAGIDILPQLQIIKAAVTD